MAMFDARAAAEELAQQHGTDVFEFVGMDGETYVLPPISTLTVRQARRLQDGDFDVLVDVVDADTCAAIDELPTGVLEQLGDEWANAAGEAGKSGGASPKTPNGGPRSKRTSRSGASTSKS